MRLLASTDLGIKALVYMAAKDGAIVTFAELAGHFGVKPSAFRRPFRPLIDNGVVFSYAGRGGGYRLQKDPNQITLGEVIRLLEGDSALVAWMDPDAGGVVPNPNCSYRFAMERAKKAMLDQLDKFTVGALAANPETLAVLKIARATERSK